MQWMFDERNFDVLKCVFAAAVFLSTEKWIMRYHQIVIFICIEFLLISMLRIHFLFRCLSTPFRSLSLGFTHKLPFLASSSFIFMYCFAMHYLNTCMLVTPLWLVRLLKCIAARLPLIPAILLLLLRLRLHIIFIICEDWRANSCCAHRQFVIVLMATWYISLNIIYPNDSSGRREGDRDGWVCRREQWKRMWYAVLYKMLIWWRGRLKGNTDWLTNWALSLSMFVWESSGVVCLSSCVLEKKRIIGNEYVYFGKLLPSRLIKRLSLCK